MYEVEDFAGCYWNSNLCKVPTRSAGRPLLVTNASAPAAIASPSITGLQWPETAINRIPGSACRSFRNSWNPFSTGMSRSATTTSIFSSRLFCRASWPFDAVPTTRTPGIVCKQFTRACCMPGKSSATRARTCRICCSGLLCSTGVAESFVLHCHGRWSTCLDQYRDSCMEDENLRYAELRAR